MEASESTCQQQKRKRAANFTPDEQMLCLNIIKKHKQVIENKTTNAVTQKEKEGAWDRVANEFNACSGMHRTAASLKKMYENKKKETRKLAACEKRETFLTGGGKKKTVLNDPVMETTLDIINSKTVYGLYNRFGDADPEMPSTSAVPDDIEDIDLSSEGTNGNLEAKDWGDYKSSHLQSPINKKLQPAAVATGGTPATPKEWAGRRRPQINSTSSIASKYEELADLKIELAKIHLEIAKQQQQHEERRAARREEQEKEEFQLKRKTMLLDIKLKEKQLEKLNEL